MRRLVPLILLILIFGESCGRAAESDSNSSQLANALTDNRKLDQNSIDDKWTPDAINDCLSRLKSPEPVEIEDSFNPYYLRADLDGNKDFEYAILMRSVSDKKKRGLVICKDGKDPFFFGTVSRSKAISYGDDENFITNDWEILSRNETEAVTKYDTDGKKIGKDAKGESIGFIFEGGGFFIYWDGKRFKGVGGA